jgi:nicotinate-nucleotide--dimethylbenzimidazole phosphoribosyltransferase
MSQTRIADTCADIIAPDQAIAELTQRKLDAKTKPRRSLGRLEDLACQYAAIVRNAAPAAPNKTVVVMGADHGVAAQGVSAYPQEVTAQMLLNFARGGAAINVLARHAAAQVLVVDMGVREAVLDPAIESVRIGPGTADFTLAPAMTRAQCQAAVCAGIDIAQRLAADGCNVVGLGDMGIGNTTASSALTAALTGAAVEEVTGFGTGISDAVRLRKIAAIRAALQLHQPDRSAPLSVLEQLGGFEIAGLCGLVLGAAASRMAVVLDGFIASVAALLAVRIAPEASGYLLPSHRSVEAGHRIVLRELGKTPLFDFDMRLGEGTGAALAMTLLDASLMILNEMATFTSAGVSDAGA